MNQRAPNVGILAYGSLIDDPGNELAPLISQIISDVTTPFPVEFARKSSSRGYAPTLVPHPDGAQVRAAILVVRASLAQAEDMLWRRETRTNDVTMRYPGDRPHLLNAVQVKRVNDFAGIDHVLYTQIGANIAPLTPEHLAKLAVESVKTAPHGKDGISYLMDARNNGISTPLSSAYEAEILQLAKPDTLQRALVSLRAMNSAD
ncbi:hypothetical protein [Roseibium album]|uniref:hypothetical protein n=1 Tax=Roseibium album TaxID=311410 RepID=UPI003918F2BE